ncbi:MAG TPA: acyl-CoA--6-aminopenicillanic acid acyltransferase, partial [Turneriella sp.]|nr:acyl-CoA--6-aminopenicillanic acid acyltransferase [Turneriella sp.]
MQPILNAPLVVRLKGTQKEMGGQYGEILAAQGGYQDLLEFYPHMAENLLVSGLPRRARTKTARFIASQLIQTAARSLSKYRNDEYAARQSALLKAAGITEALAQQQLVMDVFQNSIGVLGRFGILHANERAYLNAIPACTSAVVWDSLSRDGELMHARNFDFPGVGVWDKIPTIVYSTPDKGIPYGYIGARGADVPGITAFNSEGLSVAFHTRFHRDVDFNALGVIDLG